MAKTYHRDDGEAQEVLDLALQWHPTLRRCGVRIDILFVDDYDDSTGESRPALKAHGYPAAATIAIVQPKHRALGLGDALLTIDTATWAGLPVRKRIALLDHELTHLEVLADDGGIVMWNEVDERCFGVPKLDDMQRPKLRIRLHDYQLGGFRTVAKRHAEDAPEADQVRALIGSDGQVTWDFEATLAGQDFARSMGLGQAEGAARDLADAKGRTDEDVGRGLRDAVSRRMERAQEAHPAE